MANPRVTGFWSPRKSLNLSDADTENAADAPSAATASHARRLNLKGFFMLIPSVQMETYVAMAMAMHDAAASALHLWKPNHIRPEGP
jgi:hypothetical protein